MYLKIENPGTAAVEAFTLFGATSKRDSTDPRMIGTFGSGSKHAICLFLRHDLNPQIFCGPTKLAFFTEPVNVKGVNDETKTHHQVCVLMSGKVGESTVNRKEKLSVTLDYGTSDWGTINLGLRELVSNAIDACYEQGLDHTSVTVEIVGDNQVRAKAGTTRVFVPLNEKVQNFYNNLGRWFLHFSEPESLNTAVLHKRNRNFVRSGDGEATKRACMYRRGVFVREMRTPDQPSLFDYNLNHLDLNESRTFNEWEAKEAIGHAIAYARPAVIASVLRCMVEGTECFESHLDADALAPTWSDRNNEKVKEELKANWEAAIRAVGGDKGMLTGKTGFLIEAVEKKGWKPMQVNLPWMQAASNLGITTELTVLTKEDKDGIEFKTPTPDVQKVMNHLWNMICDLGLNNQKMAPSVRCFFKLTAAGGTTNGFQSGNTVNIHTDIADGISNKLLEVSMEELAHYVTNADDFSRDFQNYLFTVIIALMKKQYPLS